VNQRHSLFLWTAVLLLALAYMASRFTIEMRQADRHAYLYGYPKPNDQALSCVASAACMRKTGIFLAIFDSKQHLQRIEDVAQGNDGGETFLADVAAVVSSSEVTLTTMVRINACINALGVFFLGGMLVWIGLRWAGALCVFAGAYYAMPGPIPSADLSGMFIGIFCLAAIPSLWLAGLYRPSSSPRALFGGTAFSWFCLAWANFLREPMGTLGAVLAVLCLVVLFLFTTPRKAADALRLLVGVAIIYSALLFAPFMFHLRNVLFHFSPSHLTLAHGIWHTMYVGLGTLPNPWGISWDDFDAFARYQKINPGAEIYTPVYYQSMRQAYWEVLRHDPKGVFFMYLTKSRQVLFAPLKIIGLHVFVWASLVFVGVPLALARVPVKKSTALAAAWVLALWVAGILLQGVLAIPHRMYLYPVTFVALVMLCCFLDFMEQPF
jgi:hypothetical protein